MRRALVLFAGPTMDVVEMVLSGRVNKGLVTLIQQAGGRAVGVCGKDSGIIKARMVNSSCSLLKKACLQICTRPIKRDWGM